MIMINPIYGQSLIKENCHNSRTSHDINTRLVPVTILGKINKTTLKRTGDDPCQSIVTSSQFFKLWPIRSNSEAGFYTQSVKFTI